MKFPEQGDPLGNKSINQTERKLIYSSEFKNFIKENPGVLNDVHKILKDNDPSFNIMNEDGVTINRLESSSTPTFKIEKGDDAFFVKINYLPSSQLGEKGFDEFIATQKAKEVLKNLSWVDVVDPQLGYKDDKYAYYVSKWNDLLSDSVLYGYIKKLKLTIEKNPNDSQNEKMEVKDLESKIEILKQKLGLAGYFDVFSHNMAYDQKTKKIHIFDLQMFKADLVSDVIHSE